MIIFDLFYVKNLKIHITLVRVVKRISENKKM